MIRHALRRWYNSRGNLGVARHRGSRSLATAIELCLVTPLVLSGRSVSPPRVAVVGRDTASRAAFSPWCDSTMVTDTAGRRQIPLLACSATPAESTALRRAFRTVTQALTLYGRLTGIPYPWEQYVMHVEPAAPMSMGGQATGPGHMQYNGPLPDSLVEHDRVDVTAKILVHELAHQWFAEYVQNAGHSGWLSEGFADFMTGQVWGATQGPQGEEEFLFFYNTGWSAENANDPASQILRTVGEYAPYGWYSIPWPGAHIWKQPLDADNDLYYRGATVLWMLQQYLGDTRFWASVNRYVTAHAHGTADSHDFQQAIQAATGEDLTWFFTEWVYGTGYPHFTVAADYQATAHRMVLHVTQATPVFRMPVTVRVGTADGDVLAHTLLDTTTQTVVIEHVLTAPTFVVFDDGDAIVKTVEFPQPTAWLVAQVRREARPWQTWWAIEQLRQRAATDSVAANALVAAVRTGRYALTRAQAAVAIGAVASPASLAALRQGVRDTAVIVRRAALQGLEALRTPRAVAVARAVFAHNASPLVRADALQSVLLSPLTALEDRQTLFAQSIAQPSYRDVVSIVALKVMGTQYCDSTTMATFRSTLGKSGVTERLETILPTLAWVIPACQSTFASQLQASRAGAPTARTLNR